MKAQIKTENNFLDKAGIPKHLAWGYLGILIFMMGDGVEQGWLSPYLIGRGMTIQQSASLFTVYGVTIAISSWFSGVLAEGYGPKRTMLMGIILYILGTVGFVGYGMPELNFPVMLSGVLDIPYSPIPSWYGSPTGVRRRSLEPLSAGSGLSSQAA